MHWIPRLLCLQLHPEIVKHRNHTSRTCKQNSDLYRYMGRQGRLPLSKIINLCQAITSYMYALRMYTKTYSLIQRPNFNDLQYASDKGSHITLVL